MNPHPFALTPFPGGPETPFRIGGTITRQVSRLTLAWRLTGPVAAVTWPSPAAQPARRDRLWETTCCECFLARPEETGYWEANLSPTGHWQLYRFDGYREGMRPEAGASAVAIAATQDAAGLRLTANLDLAPMLPPDQPLQIGVTMVVRSVAGATSYWALAHPGERPDFHHRASFALAL